MAAKRKPVERTSARRAEGRIRLFLLTFAVLQTLAAPVALAQEVRLGRSNPLPTREFGITPIPVTHEIQLSPKQLVQMAVARNADISYSKLNIEVAGYVSAAEAGLYEAVFSSTMRREDRTRLRTTQEKLQGSPLNILSETVNVIDAGFKARAPTGADISLNYTLEDRRNNIIANSTQNAHQGEYTGSLILSIKQPLLRGEGNDIVETDKKIAEIDRQIAVLQLRQQIMKTCSDMLANYWQLYRARQVLKLRLDSVENARRILEDTKPRVAAGRVPQTALIEVRSTILNRESEAIRAQQALRDAESKILTALSLNSIENQGISVVPVVPEPGKVEDPPGPTDLYQQALKVWPAFQIAQLKRDQSALRLNFARNQRKPNLDFVMNYGTSGLSFDRKTAVSLTTSGLYPDWYAGLVLELPLQGNLKAEGQYSAQATRVRQSDLELDAISVSLANDLLSRWDELVGSRRVVQQMQEDIDLRTELLESERLRYKIGAGLLGQLLQRENDLLDSRQRMLEAQVRVELARAAFKFADGSLLIDYDITLRD